MACTKFMTADLISGLITENKRDQRNFDFLNFSPFPLHCFPTCRIYSESLLLECTTNLKIYIAFHALWKMKQFFFVQLACDSFSTVTSAFSLFLSKRIPSKWKASSSCKKISAEMFFSDFQEFSFRLEAYVVLNSSEEATSPTHTLITFHIFVNFLVSGF